MKISIERLRQIITEEVIKEELSPDIAAPAIAAMLQGMDPEATSDIFGDAFNQMYGEGSLEGEAERQAGLEEPAEEDFPTDYQAGGAYGDRPKIGFEEDLERIIKEELQEMLDDREVLVRGFGKLTLNQIERRLVEMLQEAGDGAMKNPPDFHNLKTGMIQAFYEAYRLHKDEERIDEGYGGEGSMARKQLGRTAELAMMIQGMVTDESNLEEWVESKITKAQDYLTSVMNYMRGDQLSEDMASRDDIAALRQQVGNMSYEIERMLVALMKAGYSMEDIMQMASELRKMDPHPADVQVAERKLSKAEEKEKEKVVKGMKKSKKDFEKRYGDDAESVMYATATKMAKEKKD